MHFKKPLPLTVTKPRPLCPVCGKASYSLGGIHPQCAQAREDAPRMEFLKATKKAEQQKARIANPARKRHGGFGHSPKSEK